jgi:deoxycytidylate deaminase
MQAAFTAKANSGCLSRQVGAVVTDSDYNILSIGWNDVPRCDISCSRKNFIDICKEEDLGAYTEYEIKNKDFRIRIDRIFKKNAKELTGVSIGDILCGLPWRYCFKDTNADHREPMRSRAMHAEEKALARVQESARGGYLFTTSSPCEMCSKNAKDHKISKIYYIEPYPGISEDQYSRSGDVNNRAKHILFTGAIGRAYTQMYTPIMPYKDVLEFLGVRK